MGRAVRTSWCLAGVEVGTSYIAADQHSSDGISSCIGCSVCSERLAESELAPLELLCLPPGPPLPLAICFSCVAYVSRCVSSPGIRRSSCMAMQGEGCSGSAAGNKPRASTAVYWAVRGVGNGLALRMPPKLARTGGEDLTRTEA